MSEGEVWQGPWSVRLYERLRERGYDSLTAFAEAHPTASLVALAEELGKDDLAAVQVFSVLLAEAERRKQLTRLMRGQLLRQAPQGEGWGEGLRKCNPSRKSTPRKDSRSEP